MEEGQAIAAVVRTFPGTTLVPKLIYGGGVLRSCTDCLHGVDQGTSTVMVDNFDLPWHDECYQEHRRKDKGGVSR